MIVSKIEAEWIKDGTKNKKPKFTDSIRVAKQ